MAFPSSPRGDYEFPLNMLLIYVAIFSAGREFPAVGSKRDGSHDGLGQFEVSLVTAAFLRVAGIADPTSRSKSAGTDGG